jgi:hypothetical protein
MTTNGQARDRPVSGGQCGEIDRGGGRRRRASIWLVQRGSAESKEVDRIGAESDADQLVGAHARRDSPPWVRAGDWRTAVFSRSLGIAMGGIFHVPRFLAC